jgi:acylaminoacyl-peptidase
VITVEHRRGDRRPSVRHAVGIVVASALAVWSARAGAGAAPSRPPLEPMDIFRLELATDPRISPDGSEVVYVRRWSDLESDRRCANLWLIDIESGAQRPLSTGVHNDASPRWSRDGRSLAFVSNRDGSPQIYRRWMENGETAKLTQLPRPPAGLAWSPDGRWISFAMHVPEPPRRITDLPQAPPGATWARAPRVIDRAIYRLNGRGYLEPGYTQLFVIPADGGTARQITRDPYHHGGPPGMSNEEAVWTPDGRHLILAATRRADWEFEFQNSEIWEIAVEDGAARALTDREGPDATPAVSHDGRRIAYVGFDDRYQAYQVRRLYVMNRDGSGSRVVTASFDRDVIAPEWAPDDRGVYFLADDRGTTGLYLAGLDGSVELIAANVGATLSAYGGGGAFTLARDGAFALTTTRPDLPGDIAIGRAGVKTPAVLTAVNAELLGARSLGALEAIEFASSRDARSIHGWVLTPPGFDPSKRHPLILEIHGGPVANYGNRFDVEKQLMAARGYVVVYINPRGSSSYGEEFGNLLHHAYPGDDFFDLESAVDAVLARGFVDRERLFITGGSGGGILTCWAIGRTDRYRAAVTAYPNVNWYSFSLIGDLAPYMAKYFFPGPPWENLQHFEERSPLALVGKVKTPTMVMTGEEDWRTPISESEQYYQALKRVGVDTVLVRVPDEPHGISMHPSHHIAKVLYTLGWFEQHGGLGAGGTASKTLR